MPFDAFLASAWNDHGDRPRDVADRLAASLRIVTAPEHVAPYAGIVTHVFGEHLGEWVGVITDANLSMALVDSPDPVVAGAQLSYTATLSNGHRHRVDVSRVHFL